MKRISFWTILALTFFTTSKTSAQQGIGTDKPNKASVLDLTSTSRGVLFPRVALKGTSQFDPVSGIDLVDSHTANSLIVFNTENAGSGVTAVKPGYYYWEKVSRSSIGQWVRLINSTDISDITLDGDVIGALKNNKVQKIQNVPVSSILPLSGQLLQFNGTNWLPTNPAINVSNILTSSPIVNNGTATVPNIAINRNNLVTGASFVNATNAVTLDSGATNAVVGGSNATITVNNTAALWNANQLQGKTVVNVAPVINQVLQFNGTNWTPANLNAPTVTAANNGLTLNGTTTQLGGNLTQSTTITNTANFDLTLATNTAGATGKLKISGLDKTKTQGTTNVGVTSGITEHILAVDANNVVKALKATMPKFFYMPSIIVPTTNSQFVAINSSAGESFIDATRTGILNLYERYKVQFGTTGTATQPSSPSAPLLPVLPASELHYYVTWYDTNVFSSVTLDAVGKMTYVVKVDADVTLGSFMNIVFAVKEN